MIPAAVERARALLRHANYLGAPLPQFEVTVTKAEAFELLPWLRDSWALNPGFDLAQLDFDIAHAQAADNPWIVLAHFNLLGLAVVRREDLH